MDWGFKLKVRYAASNISISSEAGIGLPSGWILLYRVANLRNALVPESYVAREAIEMLFWRSDFICSLRK